VSDRGRYSTIGSTAVERSTVRGQDDINFLFRFQGAVLLVIHRVCLQLAGGCAKVRGEGFAARVMRVPVE